MQEFLPLTLVIFLATYLTCAFIPTVIAFGDMIDEIKTVMEYFQRLGFPKKDWWPLKNDHELAMSFLKYASLNLFKVIFYIISCTTVIWVYGSWC